MADHPPVPGREIASFTLRGDSWMLYDSAEGDPDPTNVYITGNEFDWASGKLLPTPMNFAGLILDWPEIAVIAQLVAAHRADMATRF